MSKKKTVEADDDDFGRDLPEELDLMAAEPLKGFLRGALSSESALVLDASRVERLTTPCIQVLLAAGRAAEQQNTEFKLLNPSEAFTAAFANLGLGAELNRWS